MYNKAILIAKRIVYVYRDNGILFCLQMTTCFTLVYLLIFINWCRHFSASLSQIHIITAKLQNTKININLEKGSKVYRISPCSHKQVPVYECFVVKFVLKAFSSEVILYDVSQQTQIIVMSENSGYILNPVMIII